MAEGCERPRDKETKYCREYLQQRRRYFEPRAAQSFSSAQVDHFRR